MHDSYSKLTSDNPPPYTETCSTPFHSSPTADPAPILGLGLGPGLGLGSGSGSRKKLAKTCGCGPKTWTKIIATIQIIVCGISLVWRLAAACNFIDSDGNNLNRTNVTFQHWEDDEEEIAINLFYEYNGNPISQALETLIGLSFGCILFAGAHYGKPVLLLIWMVMQGLVIGVFALAILALVFVLCIGGGLLAVFFILIVLIPTGISVFCFYIVSRHRRELIDQQQLRRQEHLNVEFHSANVH